jgi:hypothetical protein
MGFTVPNATDYSANLIASLDQAEPDALDFEVLGHRSDAVISGGDIVSVTTAAGNSPAAYLNVQLSTVEVRIDNDYGTIAGSTVIVPLAPATTDARFDLICAYNNGGTFQFAVVTGTTSATNPVFPHLPASQIPLYAVYVKNTFNQTYSTELLVDKRVVSPSSIARKAAGVPAGSSGNIGDEYINTTVASNTGQSQVYVKTGATTWTNLAQYVQTLSTNTANSIVYRDASGNFAAGAVTATSFTGSGAGLTSIPGSAIASGGIGTTQLANEAVTVDKLAAGAPRAGFNSTQSTATITSNNYTLVASDLGKLIELGPTTANMTVTVPTDSVAFSVGDRVDLLQTTGTYTVTVQAAGGVTLNAEGSKFKLKGQWAAATLVKRGANTWVLIGNLIA